MQYRRAFVPGGSFFFTVVTERRYPWFSDPVAIERLRCAFRTARDRHPFSLEAIVVLPDHLHCIWTLPPGDADFSSRWRLIKTHFTKSIEPPNRPSPTTTRQRRREQMIWQRRFWEHALRDEIDWHHHLDYIHYNPVKHGLARSPGEWPHSSFQRFVALGLYPPDWGRGPMTFEGVGCE